MKKLILIVSLLFLCACSTAHFYPIVEGDCADRALAIKKYLKKEGYETRVKIGIVDLKERKGHAWVEYKKPYEKEWLRIDNLRSADWLKGPSKEKFE